MGQERTTIRIVDGIDYMEQVKTLIAEYTRRLGRNLSFQNIEEELANPSEKYTAPEGEVLVAVNNKEQVIGMVAYHRHTKERCEMKRLYITPEGRGNKIGDKLVMGIILHAKNAGYKEMVLDTLKPLEAAIHLYKKHGFAECEAYYHNPFEDVIYMRKDL